MLLSKCLKVIIRNLINHCILLYSNIDWMKNIIRTKNKKRID